MKTRFLCGALLLSLVSRAGYAVPSVEALEKQEFAKLEQLYILGEKIKTLEQSITFLKQKRNEFFSAFLKMKELNFLSNNQGKTLTVQEKEGMKNDFICEWQRFAIIFSDIKNKTGQCIVNDNFFNGVEDAETYKFYMAKYAYDADMLKKLLSEWEKLSDECFVLGEQIKLAKGL